MYEYQTETETGQNGRDNSSIYSLFPSFSLSLSLLLSGNSRLHHAQAIYPANPRTFRGRFAIPRKYLANLDVLTWR